MFYGAERDGARSKGKIKLNVLIIMIFIEALGDTIYGYIKFKASWQIARITNFRNL